jgi:hypothetical protein
MEVVFMKSKKLMSILLTFTMVFVFSLFPASIYAQSNEVEKEEVYTSKVGNKVLKVNDNSNTQYVIISKPVEYNDLKDEKTKEKAKSKESQIIGKRVYFEVANNLEDAIKIADNNPNKKPKQDDGEVSTSDHGDKHYFWDGSYTETTYNWIYGSGVHTYISSEDVSDIKTTGSIIAQTLGTVILGALGLSVGWSAVIAAGIVVAGLTIADAYVLNSDGSMDAYSYAKYTDINNDNCVNSGEYVGEVRFGTGDWFKMDWLYDPFCL